MNCVILNVRQGLDIDRFAYCEGGYEYYYPKEVYYFTPDSDERHTGAAPDGMYVVFGETTDSGSCQQWLLLMAAAPSW